MLHYWGGFAIFITQIHTVTGFFMSKGNEVIIRFSEECTALARELVPHSSLIYELHLRELSAGIEKLLRNIPREYQEEARQLAREEFDYQTPAQIAEEIRRNRESGICSHEVDIDCCLLGCGDRYD